MKKPGTANAADDRRSMAGVLVFMGSPPAMQARKARWRVRHHCVAAWEEILKGRYLICTLLFLATNGENAPRKTVGFAGKGRH
ncbi:hypothetical protein [Variovorax sp. UC122_21]|uniref:hypothetical protein n=1 Tax=Variovorax sp. UC122_21 TaxID=3374554 RepID=UPI0037578F31